MAMYTAYSALLFSSVCSLVYAVPRGARPAAAGAPHMNMNMNMLGFILNTQFALSASVFRAYLRSGKLRFWSASAPR